MALWGLSLVGACGGGPVSPSVPASPETNPTAAPAAADSPECEELGRALCRHSSMTCEDAAKLPATLQLIVEDCAVGAEYMSGVATLPTDQRPTGFVLAFQEILRRSPTEAAAELLAKIEAERAAFDANAPAGLQNLDDAP